MITLIENQCKEQLAKQQKFFALGLLSLKPCVLSIFKKIVLNNGISLWLYAYHRVFKGTLPLSQWFPTGAVSLEASRRTETANCSKLADLKLFEYIADSL